MSRLGDYLRALARGWWLALLPLAAVAAVTAATYRQPAVVYQATVRYSIGIAPENIPNQYNYDRYYVWIASEYMARSLASVLNTGAFVDAVARRLGEKGLSVTPGQIQSGIATDLKNNIVVLYLTLPDAQTIGAVAAGITAELAQNTAAYWPQTAGAPVPPVRQLDEPAPAPVPVSLRDRFDLPIRLALALIAGVGLAFLAHFVDPFIRDRRDIDRLRIPVAGELLQ